MKVGMFFSFNPSLTMLLMSAFSYVSKFSILMAKNEFGYLFLLMEMTGRSCDS